VSEFITVSCFIIMIILFEYLGCFCCIYVAFECTQEEEDQKKNRKKKKRTETTSQKSSHCDLALPSLKTIALLCQVRDDGGLNFGLASSAVLPSPGHHCQHFFCLTGGFFSPP